VISRSGFSSGAVILSFAACENVTLADARALERFGNIPKAIEAWDLLAKNYMDTPIGKKAIENIKRLRAK
jgi:hypothetical protein